MVLLVALVLCGRGRGGGEAGAQENAGTAAFSPYYVKVE